MCTRLPLVALELPVRESLLTTPPVTKYVDARVTHGVSRLSGVCFATIRSRCLSVRVLVLFSSQVVLAVDMRVDDLEQVLKSLDVDPDDGVLYVLSPNDDADDPFAVVTSSVPHSPVSGFRTDNGLVLGKPARSCAKCVRSAR